jgi:hypothetical protein
MPSFLNNNLSSTVARNPVLFQETLARGIDVIGVSISLTVTGGTGHANALSRSCSATCTLSSAKEATGKIPKAEKLRIIAVRFRMDFFLIFISIAQSGNFGSIFVATPRFVKLLKIGETL